MPAWNGLRTGVNGTRGMCLRHFGPAYADRKAPEPAKFWKTLRTSSGPERQKGKQGDQATGPTSPSTTGKPSSFTNFPSKPKTSSSRNPRGAKTDAGSGRISAPSKPRLCWMHPHDPCSHLRTLGRCGNQLAQSGAGRKPFGRHLERAEPQGIGSFERAGRRSNRPVPTKLPSAWREAHELRQLIRDGGTQEPIKRGALSEESIQIAETADLLLADYQLSGAASGGIALLDSAAFSRIRSTLKSHRFIRNSKPTNWSQATLCSPVDET